MRLFGEDRGRSVRVLLQVLERPRRYVPSPVPQLLHFLLALPLRVRGCWSPRTAPVRLLVLLGLSLRARLVAIVGAGWAVQER
jgi:hypothetical protein